jgi:hypothetical protein
MKILAFPGHVRTQFRGQNFAAFLVLFVIVIFSFAVLGDFSRAMAGWNKARDLADNAALAAANSLDAAKFNRGQTEINELLASQRAEDIVTLWLQNRFPEENFIDLTYGGLKISGQDATVTIAGKVNSVFGKFLGVGSYPIRVASSAHLIVDIQGGGGATYPICSSGSPVYVDNFRLYYDCLGASVTAEYRYNGSGSPAQATLFLPMLEADRNRDMMPQKGLAFTPVMFVPKWSRSRAGLGGSSGGYYSAGEYEGAIKYTDITVYIQANMTAATKYKSWPSLAPEGDNHLIFVSDASNKEKTENWLFLGDNISSNHYYWESPAWHLPPGQGSFNFNDDVPYAVGDEMFNSMPRASLNLSHLASNTHKWGTMKHFGSLDRLVDPQFVFLYPGESSRFGGYTDRITRQPAFGVTAITAWTFSLFAEGDKWEYKRFTEDYCTYSPEEPGYCHIHHRIYYQWVDLGWKQLDNKDINNPWMINRVIFDGVPSDAFTIPVFQAQAVLK